MLDEQSLSLVKRGGFLSVAIDANESAVRETDVMVLTENAVTTSILVEAFHRAGQDETMSIVDIWNVESIRQSGLVHDYPSPRISEGVPRAPPPGCA